jgi:hypothetical protein
VKRLEVHDNEKVIFGKNACISSAENSRIIHKRKEGKLFITQFGELNVQTSLTPRPSLLYLHQLDLASYMFNQVLFYITF